MAEQPPLLRRGALSSRIFVLTEYVICDEGVVVALEKEDVTEEFKHLLSELKKGGILDEYMPKEDSDGS